MQSAAPSLQQLADRCAALPIFPLPRVVFLPHTLLPLHVFEPRYRALIADVRAADGLLGVPALAPGWEDHYEEAPALIPSFGIGRIVRHEALPDGRCNIVLLGLGRVRLVQELPAGPLPYRVVQARLMQEAPDERQGADLRRARTQLRISLAQLMGHRPDVADQLRGLLDPDRDLAEVTDALAHLCLRDPEMRQAYLDQEPLLPRVEQVVAALAERMPGPPDALA